MSHTSHPSHTSHRHVARARLGEIDDRQLKSLRNLAHDARRGQLTEGESEYVLASIGPLLDELIERRRIDEDLCAILDAANVVPLRGPEAV